jgi:cyanophycinase-like exopeptidase
MHVLKWLNALGVRSLVAGALCAGLAVLPLGAAQAQTTVAHSWGFNEAAGTALPAVANSGPQASQWTAALAGTTTNGSGSLRVGYNSTSSAISYAPVNVPAANVGGIYAATVVFKAWDLRNGADSGTTRPVFNLGFRSAASTSSSLVADVQFTATTAGVVVVVRDSVSTFPIATLPSLLPAPLSVTLTIDKTSTVKTYTLSYAVAMPGGEQFSQTGNLGSTSGARAVSFASLQVAGNFPNAAGTPANVAPLIDSIDIGSAPAAPVTLLPPADGRPGMPSNLLTYLDGNRVQSTRPPLGGPGLLLMGGGAEVNAAFTSRAYPIINGGDIVVLRISGANGYQAYFYSTLVASLPPELQATLQPNSVETLFVDTRDKANSAYVADAVSKANMVWIAGGDQSPYIDNWKGTALAEAVRIAYKRGAVIGGTSAGMVVSGEWMYDPGTVTAVTSAVAVANPYDPGMTISTGLFELPLGYNLLNEPHFANRDRMGRTLAFMARLRKDARTSLVYGVALDEATSLFIDSNNLGTFQAHPVSGQALGNGYILREDRHRTQLVQVSPGLPLIYRNVQRIKLAPGQTFDFARGLSAQPAVNLSVEGVVPVNPY